MNHPKTILITGASSGIGAALAHAYAGEGVTLILLGRNVARLDDVADACRARGATARTLYIDVCDRTRMHDAILDADTQTPIDLVIANAGISTGSFAGTETLEAAERVFEVNMNGVLHTVHPLIPRMVARGTGQIAIMSSLAGICPLPGAPAYSASKAAVRYYAEALHSALKPRGVDVSVICPGWITTPLTDRNGFPMPFIMPVERAASIILHSLQKKKVRIFFPYQMYIALRALSILPNFMQRYLLSLIPGKQLKS